jgi:hypothetical protein
MVINSKTDEQRTIQQNRALHLYFRLLAESLNDAGFDLRKTLRQDIEIPWSERMIKEYLWRPVQKTVLGKDSTTLLGKKDIDKIYLIIDREISKRTGITIDFPSLESLMEKDI